jgi:hypothetical protein
MGLSSGGLADFYGFTVIVPNICAEGHLIYPFSGHTAQSVGTEDGDIEWPEIK